MRPRVSSVQVITFWIPSTTVANPLERKEGVMLGHNGRLGMARTSALDEFSMVQSVLRCVVLTQLKLQPSLGLASQNVHRRLAVDGRRLGSCRRRLGLPKCMRT